jgi:hypothetical protein
MLPHRGRETLLRNSCLATASSIVVRVTPPSATMYLLQFQSFFNHAGLVALGPRDFNPEISSGGITQFPN